jgi:RimJ/RimL family protein N-acetyltransferase
MLAPLDLAGRDAIRRGDLGGFDAAPGWPYEDTEPGLSFLESGGLVFLVIDDSGRVAGECGTKTPPGLDGTVEIGYGLAPPSRGHGLGGAAVSALVSRLSEDPAVLVIEAEVHVGNVASWRLLERLGFAVTDGHVGRYRRYRLATVGHLEQPRP